MQGVLYTSYEEVRLAKAQTDAQVQQTAASYAAALGQTVDYSAGPTTYTAVQILAIATADAGSSDKKQLQSDFVAFYTAWNGFMTTGTDQTSTLWFGNFPDDAEYATLLQYQAALASLQARIMKLYPSASLVVLTPASAAGVTPWGLFPSLAPAQNASATSLVYVGAALALLYMFGPLAHTASEAWSPSPKPARK
jgi:hypothetical protein